MPPVDEAYVKRIWEICVAVYLQHGHRLALPEKTDLKRTYQWRYATLISQKFAEWDFDEQTATKFIKIAINRAKERGVLKKGLAVLHQKNMLEVCFKLMDAESTRNDSVLEQLQSAQRFMLEKTKGNVAAMLERQNLDAFANIVIWYRSNRVPDIYLALSKACWKALSLLTTTDRAMMPSKAKLYTLREQFIADDNNCKAAMALLGKDWRRTTCMR